MTNKTLYVWTTEDKLRLAPQDKQLVVKIGDAFDVDGRVMGEGIDLTKRVLLKTYDIGSKRDYAYHEEASRKIYNIHRLRHHIDCETREGFAIPFTKTKRRSKIIQTSLKTIDSIVKAVGGTPQSADFIPTTWQRRAIEFIADSFDEGKKTLLLELAARFGKTGTLIQLFNYSDADVMVVANYVKTVNVSFGNTVVKFFNDNITYVDTEDPDFEAELQTALDAGRKVLVTCSLFNSAKLDRRIEAIAKVPNRFIVVDEADYGAHTPANLAKVEKLRKDVPLILMTGTNADRAAGSHDIDAHLAVTYFDMLMEVDS